MSNVIDEDEFNQFAVEFAATLIEVLKEFPDVLSHVAGKALDNVSTAKAA